MCHRLFLGWTFKEAIQPIENNLFTLEEDTRTIEFWCGLLGLDHNTTYLRLLRGEEMNNIVKE
jgi:hypothetical protein